MKVYKFVVLVLVILGIVSCKQTKKLSDHVNEINSVVKQEFTIKLKANPSTGYTWKYEIIEGNTKIEFVKNEFIPRSKATGSPGEMVYTFKTIKTGTASIKFWYSRDFENDTPALESVFYKIIITK